MRNIFLILFALLLASGIKAQSDFPEPQQPPRFVNDFTGLFNPQAQRALEQKLQAYHDSTSTQIYVVVLNDLHGYEIADYTTQLADRWKVGQKGRDNGVMILIKNKVGKERGMVHIATGYGMEGVLPDALAKRIIQTKIVPNFAKSDYYTGVDEAINDIIALASGEYEGLPPDKNDDGGMQIGSIIGVLILLVIWFWNRKNRNGGSGTLGGLGGLGGGLGGFGGFGGSRGGSSSGRGFGGGGGGRFGGGGAGGSW